jgi:hypothetical protein
MIPRIAWICHCFGLTICTLPCIFFMMQIFSILTFLQIRGSCGLIHLLKLVIWASTPHILLSVWHLVLLVINSIMEISYVALLIAHQSSGLRHWSVNFAASNGQEVTTRTMFSCCSFCLWNWFLLCERRVGICIWDVVRFCQWLCCSGVCFLL